MHTKRLMIPLLLTAVILAAAPPAHAQSKDIAGSWTLDATKSGGSNGPPMMILTIKGNDFTARMGAATAPEMSFKLDGTETVMPEGEKTKAVWKDAPRSGIRGRCSRRSSIGASGHHGRVAAAIGRGSSPAMPRSPALSSSSMGP